MGKQELVIKILFSLFWLFIQMLMELSQLVYFSFSDTCLGGLWGEHSRSYLRNQPHAAFLAWLNTWVLMAHEKPLDARLWNWPGC